MTSFRIEEVAFTGEQINAWAQLEPRFTNWPVVYTLSNSQDIYVGESVNAAARLRQHRETSGKQHLTGARVVVHDEFHKSACLDLESFLIRLFHGDGQYQVLNGNHGISDSDYFRRDEYRKSFEEIFGALKARGAFTRSIPEIENSDLFKLSPFKALTQDQAIAVEDILSGLFQDLADGTASRIVIQGSPGTGKTVVGIFLMKLLSDIKEADVSEPPESDSLLSEFFVPGYPELLEDAKIAIVVPQQSLRRSIREVFKRTPGLAPSQVMTPFEVGQSPTKFDLLIVDEAHRLNQRAAQPAGPLNAKFRDINIALFGSDDNEFTQLDWINHMSQHQIYLLDTQQAVRPADLPAATTTNLVESVKSGGRWYPLTSQMRVQAGADYVAYIRELLSGGMGDPQRFEGYDLRLFDDLGAMRREIFARNKEVGLARLVAGYAWPWVSKKDPDASDIKLDGIKLRWNSTDVDWVNSSNSINEVGSVHTVQGYDLNYAGVIVGNDLRYDASRKATYFDRSNYFDKRGMANNNKRGITYSDDDILQFVRNIYGVLLTRGIKGTYVYVCDAALREHLRRCLPVA
jgi:DUF2075 family protein